MPEPWTGQRHENCSGRQMVLAPLPHTPPSGTSPTEHPASARPPPGPTLTGHQGGGHGLGMSPSERPSAGAGSQAATHLPQGLLPAGPGAPACAGFPGGTQTAGMRSCLSRPSSGLGPADTPPAPPPHAPAPGSLISNAHRDPLSSPWAPSCPGLSQNWFWAGSSGPPRSSRLPQHRGGSSLTLLSCGWRPCWGQGRGLPPSPEALGAPRVAAARDRADRTRKA